MIYCNKTTNILQRKGYFGMERPIYGSDYRFLRFSFSHTHYTDNRAGICPHFFGYMRRGHARLVGEERTIEVREGDLFYIPAGCRYQSYWAGEPEVCFDSLAFPAFLQGEGAGVYPLQRIPFTPTLQQRYAALTERELIVNYETLGLFFLFLDAVLPHMERRESSRARGVVERALAYMAGAERLSVPALARHCRVSESGLYAAFRSVEGRTPLSAWQALQAERAAFLLRTTDLPIETIADRLGYCSAAYFRTVIRRQTGKSPRQLRREKTI